MPRALRNTITAVLAIALVGCSSGDDNEVGDGSDDLLPLPSVSVPAERLTPFCEAMTDLAERVETDPPDDVGAFILDAYLEIVDDVPAEIDEEFRAVIAELQGDATAPTPAASTTLAEGAEDFDAEGRLPGDSPSERVSHYVLFTCLDSDNNPGPAATQPIEDVVVDEESG